VPLVAPEFRPTLREELARHRPGTRRAVAAGLVAFAVAFSVWAFLPHRKGVQVVHRPDPTFNLRYGDVFARVPPRDGELLHIRRSLRGRVVDEFTVTRLALPPYRGDPAGFLPVYAERVLAQLRARYPGLRLVEEGKARVNYVAGYSILFRVGRGPDRMLGREVLLPQPPADPGRPSRDGVRMALRTWRGSGVGETRQLGAKGALKTPYRSFRYGTEAP
jgi:hypothetical protein